MKATSMKRQLRTSAILQAILALLLTVACGRNEGNGRASDSIQIKGSDTMVNVAQAWAEEYRRIEPTVNVEVSGGGSGVGIAALDKGAIDIATASRTMKPQEIEEAKRNTGKVPREFVVGFDALAVYVHKDNPMPLITEQQLAEIYREDGKTTRWSQLGVRIPGVTDDRIVLISRQSSSGTYEFFREQVLKKQDFKLGSRDMNGSKEVVELVGNTKTAIGYSGMGYVTDEVKMLPVASRAGAPAIAPTVETTLDKSYLLARSLQLYTLGEPEGAVKKFVEWTLSPAGQAIVQESGYVPVKAVETK